MGLGFVSYDDCCDFDDGYGDGPCGGYYCYRDKCRRDHKRDRDDGCCNEHDRGKGGCDEHDHGKGCCNERGWDRGCCNERCRGKGCCDEFGRGKGCRECGRDGCFGCRECGCDRGCRCKPGFGFPPLFECGPGWHVTRCGMFLNVPLGGCNMGFFMPFR